MIWLFNCGWRIAHRPNIIPDTPNTERADYAKVMLAGVQRGALSPEMLSVELTP